MKIVVILSPPPSFKNILLEICGHLRCRFTKNSPRRTKSTPAGIFCALLASASPISALGEVPYQKRHGCRCVQTVTSLRYANLQSKNGHGCSFLDEDGGGSTQQRCFCIAKTCRQQMYRDVHLLTRYLYRLFSKVLVRQYRQEVGGSLQNRGCPGSFVLLLIVQPLHHGTHYFSFF